MATNKLDSSTTRAPNAKDEGKLNARQRMFLAEMRSDPTMSPAVAAKRSGYKNPGVMGSKMMNNPIIKRAISALIVRQEMRLQRDGDELVERMWETEDFDPIEIFKSNPDGSITLRQFEDMPAKARRQITSIKVRERRRPTEDGDEVETDVEVKWIDKLKNREYLAKHHGIIEQVGSGGAKDGVTINFLADFRAKVENPDSVEVIDDRTIEARATKR